jgi:hypothetical protein
MRRPKWANRCVVVNDCQIHSTDAPVSQSSAVKSDEWIEVYGATACLCASWVSVMAAQDIVCLGVVCVGRLVYVKAFSKTLYRSLIQR